VVSSLPPTAVQEWRENWTLVFASFFGVTWMAAPAVSLGLFIEPLQGAFHWSRTDISIGMTIYSLLSTPLVPFAGAFVDKFGPRTIAIPGLVLNGLAFAAFGLLTPSIAHWAGAWVLYTLTQLMIRSILWNRAVSAAFTASRGLALGVTMAGIATAASIMPLLAQFLIDTYGWRLAYPILGIGWAGVALFFVVLFLHEPGSRRQTKASQNEEPVAQQGGLTLKQALRDHRILRIVFAAFIQTAIFSGLTLHIYALLTGSGVSRGMAASMTSVVGIATLGGQLMTGWLADRVRSTLLPVSCFLITGVGFLLLLKGGGTVIVLWLAVIAAGYGVGASINISTYLTSRYGGVAHFGKIYGLISSCMGLGSGIGPLIAGSTYDATGSYDTYLMTGAVVSLMASLAVLRLGAYPDFSGTRAPAPAGSIEEN
jgi:MFS family permease